MKGRYLLFAGRRARTRGGWHDYVSAFDSLEAALKLGEAMLRANGGHEDWYHVVDSRTLKVVSRGGVHPTEGPRIEVK